MPAAEEHMWLVRSRTEPFLARRIEAYLAQIAMILYNANAKKPKKFKDFLLFRNKADATGEDVGQHVLGAFGRIADMAKKAK